MPHGLCAVDPTEVLSAIGVHICAIAVIAERDTQGGYGLWSARGVAGEERHQSGADVRQRSGQCRDRPTTGRILANPVRAGESRDLRPDDHHCIAGVPGLAHDSLQKRLAIAHESELVDGVAGLRETA